MIGLGIALVSLMGAAAVVMGGGGKGDEEVDP